MPSQNQQAKAGEKVSRKLLLRIVAPHFVAGTEIDGRAAPIIGYMKGWPLQHIVEYCERKGWQINVVY